MAVPVRLLDCYSNDCFVDFGMRQLMRSSSNMTCGLQVKATDALAAKLGTDAQVFNDSTVDVTVTFPWLFSISLSLVKRQCKRQQRKPIEKINSGSGESSENPSEQLADCNQ